MSAIHNYPDNIGSCPRCGKIVDRNDLTAIHTCTPPESEHNKTAGELALILRKLALLDESEDGCSCELQLFSDESWNIESELRSCSIASGNDLDSLYKFCDSTALLAEKQEEI